MNRSITARSLNSANRYWPRLPFRVSFALSRNCRIPKLAKCAKGSCRMLVVSPLIWIVRGRSLASLAGMDLVPLMHRLLKFRHFIIILAIDQYGTLIRAAESLFVTQPALSRALREAEAAIGGALFQRTSHGMVPTEAGRVAVEKAHGNVGNHEDLDR